MIVAASWDLDPIPPTQALVAAIISDCLCCTNDLRVRLWRSSRAACPWSHQALPPLIQAIDREACELEAELSEPRAPVTLIAISDINSIPSSASPRVIRAWADLRVGDLIRRVKHAAEVVRASDDIAVFLFDDAARRIADAWNSIPSPEVKA